MLWKPNDISSPIRGAPSYTIPYVFDFICAEKIATMFTAARYILIEKKHAYLFFQNIYYNTIMYTFILFTETNESYITII